MRRIHVIGVCALLLSVVGIVYAQTDTRIIPPSVSRVSPPGLKRGTTATITVTGRNLAGIQTVLFDDSGLSAKFVSVSDVPEKPTPKKPGDTSTDVPLGKKQKAVIEVTAGSATKPGVHEFRVITNNGSSNAATLDIGQLTEIAKSESNISLSTAQSLDLPATISGTIQEPGEEDSFRFKGHTGDDLVFHVVANSLGSRLASVLTIRDASGRVLASRGETPLQSDAVLLFRVPADGEYTVSISDHTHSGGEDRFYRLNAGAIPYIAEAFPLGARTGQNTDIKIQGANLGPTKILHLKPHPAGQAWATVPLQVKDTQGRLSNEIKVEVSSTPEIWEHEPNDTPQQAQRVELPVTINGHISSGAAASYRGMKAASNPSPDQDYFLFHAHRGQKLHIEVAAQRLGSPLDSVIEVFEANGKPIPSATLMAVWNTTMTLADRDSQTPSARFVDIKSLEANDYVMIGDELNQIIFVPDQPDQDVAYKSYGGARIALLGTTPEVHAIDTPVYKVRLLPAGANPPANGLPLFRLNMRNDDGGPGYGQDSVLDLVAPYDGDYVVEIRDTRGLEGSDYAYRLTIAPETPDFALSADPGNPNLPRGGRVPVMVTVDRRLGYSGPVAIEVTGLPAGVTAERALIPAGADSVLVPFKADLDAPRNAALRRFKILGRALIDGREVVHAANPEAKLQVVSLMPPSDVEIALQPKTVVLEPGKEAPVTVKVTRRNGFKGRVPYNLVDLPNGVTVVNMGFTGGFVTENETTRTIRLRAARWAKPVSRQIFAVGTVESNASTEHASAPVMLTIRDTSVQTASARAH